MESMIAFLNICFFHPTLYVRFNSRFLLVGFLFFFPILFVKIIYFDSLAVMVSRKLNQTA